MNKTYHGLDAVRGFATVLVVLYHARFLLHAPWLAQSGYLAVDLFLVISGFVVAHAYENRIDAVGLIGFIKIRLVRFYPLYLLGLLLGFAEIFFRSNASFEQIGAALVSLLFALVFLPSPNNAFSEQFISPLDVPAWTLLFEIWVNIYYASYLRKRSLTYMIITSTICIIFLLYQDGFPDGSHLLEMATGSARVVFSFTLGVVIYRHQKSLPAYAIPNSVVGLLMTIYLSLPRSLWHDFIFVAFISPLIVVTSSRNDGKTAIATLSATISYGVYIIHAPVIEFIDGASHRIGVNSIAPTVAGILLLVMICLILDRVYDKPVRRWLNARRSLNMGVR